MESLDKNTTTTELEANVLKVGLHSITNKIAVDRIKDEFDNILLMITTHTNHIIETDFDVLIFSNRSSCVTESNAADFRTTWLEDGFHNVLISTPNSSTRWSCVTESSAEFKTACESIDLQYQYEDEDEVSRSSTSYRSINSICEIDPIPLELKYDLRSIAKRMITAGYLCECIQVYMSVRKPVIAAIFCRIWIDKFNIGDVQNLEWDVLEPKIQRWIQAAKVCIRILLVVEKRLYDQIFQDDACFMETFKRHTIQPFNFSEVIRINPRTTEKLFKKLHLFDALSDLLSDLDILFGWNLLEPVRVQVAVMLSSLFKTANETLLEFVSVVWHNDDDSKTPVPGGRIHPLTRCVMNYIILISDYMKLLFGSKPSSGSQIIYGDPTAQDLNFPEIENQSSLVLHQLSIIRFLQIQLVDKSNYYKNVSLSHIFLINNIQYIFHKIEGSPELRKMMGGGYLSNLTGKFRQEVRNYESSTWIGILYCLRVEGLHVRGSFSSGVSKSALKERFKTFNSMFEEVHRVQATWSVPDPQLREVLRISISEKLIPAYRSFLARFSGHIESGKHPKYIKYSVEDLEIAILDFFEGSTVFRHTRT